MLWFTNYKCLVLTIVFSFFLSFIKNFRTRIKNSLKLWIASRSSCRSFTNWRTYLKLNVPFRAAIRSFFGITSRRFPCLFVGFVTDIGARKIFVIDDNMFRRSVNQRIHTTHSYTHTHTHTHNHTHSICILRLHKHTDTHAT